MPFETRRVRITPEMRVVDGRADRLVQEMVGGSRDHITGLFDSDCVRINGDVSRETWRRLKVGDEVEVRYEVGRRYHARPRPRPHRGFAVIYEDRDLIVVDKSPELLTVPTERREPNTLIDRVSEYVRRTKTGPGAFSVHRLDRGVSGLLIFGKSVVVADRLRDQFAARKPERRYVALVAGPVGPDEGDFRTYLATDKSLRRFSTPDREIGQYAATHFTVRERLPDTTLVDVQLETGRRNQIRVHFSEAGHPVLGDPRYEPERARHRNWPYRRIALHAQTLGLIHPSTDQALQCYSQLPREMIEFILQSRTGPRRDSPPERK